MKKLALLLCSLAVFLFVAGCSSTSVEDRIDSGMRKFDSWPLEVQETIREGRIEEGFTEEQVRMAWGKPSYTVRERLNGEWTERWVWEKKSPQIGIGIGIGSWGRRGGVSGSVGTTVGGNDRVAKSVWFQEGIAQAYTE